MARKTPEVEILSYGRYTKWDKTSKELPRIVKFTQQIPAVVGEEFGYILLIQGARRGKLTFAIEHPPILDEEGNMMPVFRGELKVPTNTYSFFLGDCVWEPAAEKVGPWTLTTWLDGEEIASKTFEVIPPTTGEPD